MSDCNLWDVYHVCNIFSYTYVNLLVLVTISNCSMHSNGLFKIDSHLGLYSLCSWTKNMSLKKKFAIQPE